MKEVRDSIRNLWICMMVEHNGDRGGELFGTSQMNVLMA